MFTSKLSQLFDHSWSNPRGSLHISNRVRYIPPLKVLMVGSESSTNCLENFKNKGCILDHWDHRLSETSLLPGEHIHFETEPRKKIEGTTSISLEF